MKVRAIFWPLLALIPLALAPFLGSEPIHWKALWIPATADHRIFFDLRIPRWLLALVTGGTLGMLGGTYQILFHNPLAEPYILGISSAVTFGAAVGEILLHFSPYGWASASLGFACALVATLLLLWLAASGSLERLILFGAGMNFVLSSLLFLLLTYGMQQMGGGAMRWLFGQMPWVSTTQALLFAGVAAPFLIALILFSRHLDALSLGDSVARTLGVAPERARGFLLMLTCCLLSWVVCFTGAIGFVGLVVPHTARLLFRPATTRELFLHSFWMGALFLAFSDVLARVLFPPFEFPIGVLTTLAGGPLFLGLLWKQRR